MNKETIDYTSEEFWATAPKDATHWEPDSEEWFPSWIKVSNKGTFFWSSGGYWEEDCRDDECDYEELSKTFISRPTTFTKAAEECSVSDNWFVDGKCVALPPVGTICEYYADEDEWRRCEIVAHKDGLAVVWVNEVHIWTTRGALLRPIKKEPTIQEKVLEAWKAQGIDFAYDNEDTPFSFKVLVDFVVNNFDVKEKD